MVSGKLLPGKFLPIKSPAGEFSPRKITTQKIPTWKIPTHIFKYFQPRFFILLLLLVKFDNRSQF